MSNGTSALINGSRWEINGVHFPVLEQEFNNTDWELLDIFPFLKRKLDDWRLTPTTNVRTYLAPNVEPMPIYANAAVLGILGIPGNLMLFLLCLHRDIRRLSHSVYVGTVCVTDTFWLCLTYFSLVLQVGGTQIFRGYSSLHLCRFMYWLPAFFQMMSPWVRVAMSLDCYITILFPKRSGWLRRPVVAKLGLLIVTLLCLAAQLPFALAIDWLYFRGHDICALYDMDYVDLLPVMHVVESVGPCCLILLLNLHALIVVKVIRRQRQTATGDENNDHDKLEISIALIILNLIASVVMLPSVLVTTLLLDEPPKNLVVTDYEQRLMDALPYTGLLYTVSLAANFYILLPTSTLYRRVLLRFIPLRSSRRAATA